MERKQLSALFVINGMPYIIGHSVLPIFPIYIAQLGADASATGLYLAMIFGGLFTGTLASGWLASRFHSRKKLILLGSLMMASGMALMSVATTPLMLSLLMTMAWIGGGIGGGMVNTLAGLAADPAHRGKVFGILGMARGVAGITGGIGGAFIIKTLDYDALFIALGLTQLVAFSVALLLDDPPVTDNSNLTRNQASRVTASLFNLNFLLLMAAGALVSMAHFSSGLGRPLKMDALDLSAAAIMSTSIASGLASLLAPYVIGWLSDRLPRKRVLAMSYVAITLAALALLEASVLWHFLASTMLFQIGYSSMSVGAALVTDMLPKQALAAGMARYTSMPWLGAVIGFGTGGFVIKYLGIDATFIIMSTLPLIAIALVQYSKPQPAIRITQTQTVAAVGD